MIHDPILQSPVPQVSNAQVQQVLHVHFAFSGTLQRLGGERDLNYRVLRSDGQARLLKLSNPLEDPQVTDFHNQAMQWIAKRDPTLPVQRIHPTTCGRLQVEARVGEQRLLARLLSFVEGQPLSQVAQPGPALRRAMGQALARFDRALEGFEHPAANHLLLWDMQHAARLRPLLEHLPEGDMQRLVGQALEAFEQQALPRLAGLRRQVIHNDLNPHNVIVDQHDPEQLRNILDFGDMVCAPLVNELAVAASYQLGADDDALAPALQLIGAYHAHNPLQEQELALLPTLIATRQALALCINYWRAALYPDNRAYIMRNAQSAWIGLQGLARHGHTETLERIHAACRPESFA